MAQRVFTGTSTDTASRLDAAFELAVGRPPSEPERNASISFLNSQCPDSAPETVHRAWANFCQMLLAGNAAVYVE
jgi:hypothetical protein